MVSPEGRDDGQDRFSVDTSEIDTVESVRKIEGVYVGIGPLYL